MIWGFTVCLTRGDSEDNSTKLHVIVSREGFTQTVASDLRACSRQDSAAPWSCTDPAVCGRFRGFPWLPSKKGGVGLDQRAEAGIVGGRLSVNRNQRVLSSSDSCSDHSADCHQLLPVSRLGN